ncbi:cytochrome P450 2H2-like isoform X3 [Leptotrombidium deliense]|uniref:Cytochrome P450 2H2-like isoform X3 n=1 Tax=Leptotrombidium deliense TaxID=299467 RepID=A0A443SHE1_9ACAR|nr:cytochrome P450 2H2-like isoform X3 [Leptotrombidium deliense]
MSNEFQVLEKIKGVNEKVKTLAGIFVLFFVAGTETTATTTFHGITLLAKYPEIQKKLFKELEMFDKDSRIWFSDIDNLHYTRACIAEIQRFASAVPLNLIHLNSGCSM